jgi:serine/threonine-protein kinase
MDPAGEDAELKAAEARVGQTLAGKWRLDKLLGVGGMAAVYEATHKNNLKSVAVKVLHAELQRNEAVRTRFLREGYVANKVGHPGAVSAIDDGVDEDGSVYLVMELLSGKSLAQRTDAQGGRLDQKEVVVVAEGILDVLAAAHAQNVVHRDLKPDNIFLTGDGGVKVLDFGVARVLENTGEAKTRTGIVMGTPEYMPPEQARGRSEHIDGRSDLWAVGAMMFRLITGRYVHVAETQNEVLLLAMTEHAKPIRELKPDVHQKVAEVIDKVLSYEPLDRYQTAEDMRKALKEALAALDPPKTERPPPSAREDDIDDAAPTIPVSDFVKAKSNPSLPDDSPKPSLWVHTKATPPEPPKAPRKKNALVPILAASGALALLCVGIAYGVPRLRGDAHAAGSASASSASSMLDDDAGDDDDGGDEIEIDDDAMVPAPSATTTTAKPQTTAKPATTAKPKPRIKKRRH